MYAAGARYIVLLEKAGLAAGRFDLEMFVGERGGDAAAGRAIEKAELHEVGLVDFFDGVFFFAERGGERVEADGAAGIFLDDGEHEVAVGVVEAVLVDAQHVQRVARDGEIDHALGADLREVTDAAEKAIRYSRCAAAATRDFDGSRF